MERVRISPQILSATGVLPPHFASQEELLGEFRRHWAQKHFNVERLEDLHRAVQVKGRYLARPIGDYLGLDTFAKRNEAWLQAALELGEKAARGALEEAGLRPTDVDHFFSVTVTGVATPSLDARLVNRMGMRPDVKRTPIFGLGCVAGAAGTARACDTLLGDPGGVALLLSVELCSLTLQREDVSVPNIIASGLFGDGAAAVVLGGGDRPAQIGPRVVATRSVFYPDTERMMGWDMVDGGFKVVLSAKVPELARARARDDVESFLGAHDLRRKDIRHWIAHTGGPKILEAFESALELPPQALERSWRSLAEQGNLSSASVLFVLRDLFASRTAQIGDWGLLFAMGPGFCSELVLLRW
nr:alpha-pyrone synthesis polyketide synthase-like Pks11 [uncultured bacterium]